MYLRGTCCIRIIQLHYKTENSIYIVKNWILYLKVIQFYDKLEIGYCLKNL